jgi:class 3 adenylate cyclase/tetratricopeptide (TPR) repeat protein
MNKLGGWALKGRQKSTVQCSHCLFANPVAAHSCKNCGALLAWECPECQVENTPTASCCHNCGFSNQTVTAIYGNNLRVPGEHKVVTAVFTDLSSYTALSESLDPEELQGIMEDIFRNIRAVVEKYGGHVEALSGDGAMILFGLQKTNEDDAVRAVKASLEIHAVVEKLNRGSKRGLPELSMHTGINSGTVLIDSAQADSGLLGSSINIAARLSGLAKPGEIIIGNETYNLANRFFDLEYLGELKLKGRACPEKTHKILGVKDKPQAVRRIRGLRAALTGRDAELSKLQNSLAGLREGDGQVVLIKGDAGIGKSRLVEEFMDGLDSDHFQLLVGHSYPYSKNIAYFTIVDLISRAWRINEDDPAKTVKKKIETNLNLLLGESHGFSPYIGSLYALNYAELEGMGPEYWKENLFKAIKKILSAFTGKATTIIFLEDVQWADPSSLELIKYVLKEKTLRANFVFISRPRFSLFSAKELKTLAINYQEIVLRNLSSPEAALMVESLLGTQEMPDNLRSLVNKRLGGNPFYLEQTINSLIESKSLVQGDGDWVLAGDVSSISVPISIKELISSRLDRLDSRTKQLIQEASIIGRVFNHEILMKITTNPDGVAESLARLEQLNLINMRSLKPDVEYAFKHLLIQEVAYGTILKRDRQLIHEKIGAAIESLFADRIQEVSEMLAFHFKNGTSIDKSINYLIQAGEKGLKRYSVGEAHKYFSEAYGLLAHKHDETEGKNLKIADLLITWAMCFYYRADFRAMEDLLKAHEDLLLSVADQTRLGMFYVWLGTALQHREKYQEAYGYLAKAVAISDETGAEHIASYAYIWAAIVCCELGLMNKALEFAEEGRRLTRLFDDDPFVQHMALNISGYISWVNGDRSRTREFGQALLRFAHTHRDTRSLVNGHWVLGLSHLIDGSLDEAIASFQKAMEVSMDPWLTQLPKLNLAISYLSLGKHEEAEEHFRAIVAFSDDFGMEVLGNPAKGLLGVVYMAKGSLNAGMRLFEEYRQHLRRDNCKWRLAVSEFILASVYLDIYEGQSRPKFMVIMKNWTFVLRHALVAARRAKNHLENAIKQAQDIGAHGLVGESYLRLGMLQSRRGEKQNAKDSLLKAMEYFQEGAPSHFASLATEQLKNLDSGNRYEPRAN